MAKNLCPECEGELERTATKKAGMEVLKHKDPAAAKAAGCGMGFITVRKKGAQANGQEETGTPKKIETPKAGESEGGYRAAVKRAAGRGKSGRESNGKSKEPVSQTPAASAGTGTVKVVTARRGFFDDVTDTIFRK